MAFGHSSLTSQISFSSYGVLVLVDSLTLKTSWGTDYPYQLAFCTLSTDGEVIPVWEIGDTSSMFILLALVYLVLGGGLTYVIRNHDWYLQERRYPLHCRRSGRLLEEVSWGEKSGRESATHNGV